ERRTENPRVHTAMTQPQYVSQQEHILYSGPKALDRHRCFVALSFLIGVTVKVFQVQAGNDNHGGLEYALPGLVQANIHDFRVLSIHLQILLPCRAHLFCQARLEFSFGENDETPWLSSMWRGSPARCF